MLNTENKVAILLCTFNGEKFIEEQLRSIVTQSHQNWIMHISDDGSTDNTLEIIASFAEKYGNDKIKLYSGPRKGFAQNFVSLLVMDIEADFYAFCDQDDIWHKDKLKVALSSIAREQRNEPVLYCGRTCLIDSSGEFIGYSPLFRKKASFKNALVQSIAGGNTMVINKPLKKIAELIPSDIGIISHDWTLYQLSSACGCKIIYDEEPYVFYRQHGDNLIGSNNDFLSKLYRFKMLLGNKFRYYSEVNLNLLRNLQHIFTEQNRSVFELFYDMRNAPFVKRICIFLRLRVYRQTFWGNCGLLFAIIFKKI